jgi:hypothetical protein
MTTSAYLAFTGADHSTVFTDTSGKTWTGATGTNAEIIDNSLSLDGASYIHTPGHADFDNGSGDNTIHGYIKFNSLPGVGLTQELFDQADDANNRIAAYICEDTGDYYIGMYIVSGGVDLLDMYCVLPLPTVATWYHWAFSRSGNNNRLYFNGLQVGSTVVASYTCPTLTSNLNLGVRYTLTQNFFNGRMDDFTWDKGTALWTGATYTPPARSSTPAPPPIPAGASTDPPEWMLYDSDFKTALHVLRGYDAKLYLRLNDAGAGEITVPVNIPDPTTKLMIPNPVVADLTMGRFVALRYRGEFRGGFFIENRDKVDIDSEEYAGRALKVSGRGMLALIDDAIVWDWNTPGTENIRYFGTKDVITAYGGAPVPKGLMMCKLLEEALDSYAPGYVPPVNRYCWHLGGIHAGDIILTWDFSATNDSNGFAWTDAEDMEYSVGFGLFEVLKQIAELEYDFTMSWSQPDGLFTLHAYKTRIGTDRSNTIYFRLGNNCLELTNSQAGAEIRNAILVAFSHPTVPYTFVDDATSMTNYRRRESLLQSSNANTKDTADAFGIAEMNRTKDPIDSVMIIVSDAVAPMVFVDYAVGDTVSYDDMTGAIQEYRIIGMQLAWEGDEQYARVTLEME